MTAKRLFGTSKRDISKLALLSALLFSAMFAGCATVINVPAGPEATDPRCAQFVLATPEKVAGLDRTRASSQATTAWGEAGAAITLQCGSAEAVPGIGNCHSLSLPVAGKEETFDWIASEDEAGWSYISYGRTPIVTVQVPKSANLEQPTAALIDLSRAISMFPAEKACY